MAEEKFLIIATPMPDDCFGRFSETANRAAISAGTADPDDAYSWIEATFEIQLVRWREATHICSFTPSARLEFNRGLFRREYGEPARSANELAEALLRFTEGRAGSRADATHDAARLTALGEVANALATLQCNGVVRREADGRTFGSWIEGDDEALEAARDKVRAEANDILKPYGARVDSIKGDPRGHTLLLVLPGQTNRGFGGNLWGVG